MGPKQPTVPSECRVSAWLLAGDSSPTVLFPAPGGGGSGEDSPRGPGPPSLSQASPSVSGRMNGATARNVSGEDERILGLDLEMQTHRCLFVQQRDKYKRVLPSVLLGRWEVSGVPRRVGQAAPGITAPEYSSGQPPAPAPISVISAERLLSLALCPALGPTPVIQGLTRARQTRVSAPYAPVFLQANRRPVRVAAGAGGEPKQGQSAGWGQGLGRASPSRGVEVGT